MKKYMIRLYSTKQEKKKDGTLPGMHECNIFVNSNYNPNSIDIEEKNNFIKETYSTVEKDILMNQFNRNKEINSRLFPLNNLEYIDFIINNIGSCFIDIVEETEFIKETGVTIHPVFKIPYVDIWIKRFVLSDFNLEKIELEFTAELKRGRNFLYQTGDNNYKWINPLVYKDILKEVTINKEIKFTMPFYILIKEYL